MHYINNSTKSWICLICKSFTLTATFIYCIIALGKSKIQFHLLNFGKEQTKQVQLNIKSINYMSSSQYLINRIIKYSLSQEPTNLSIFLQLDNMKNSKIDIRSIQSLVNNFFLISFCDQSIIQNSIIQINISTQRYQLINTINNLQISNCSIQQNISVSQEGNGLFREAKNIFILRTKVSSKFYTTNSCVTFGMGKYIQQLVEIKYSNISISQTSTNNFRNECFYFVGISQGVLKCLYSEIQYNQQLMVNQSFSILNQQCYCPLNQVLSGGICQNCPNHSQYIDMFSCQCQQSAQYNNNNNSCICFYNYSELQNGSCALCPKNSQFSSHFCNCLANFSYSNTNNTCTCKDNYTLLISGTCQQCPQYSQYNSGQCTCISTMIYNSQFNLCNCPNNQVLASNTTCMTCPHNSVFMNYICICNGNATYSNSINICSCNANEIQLNNFTCRPCPTTSMVANNQCICQTNSTYSQSNNVCYCNFAYVLLSNGSCQQCPNGSNYISYGSTCLCANQVYSITTNLCQCQYQYLYENVCVSQCKTPKNNMVTGVCSSLCSNLYPYNSNSMCVSQCIAPQQYVQEAVCVTKCNGSYVQNGTQCSNNCIFSYINGSNQCLALCSNSNNSYVNIVSQTCIPPACQTSSSSKYINTLSAIQQTICNQTVFVWVVNVNSVNDSIINITLLSLQPNQNSSLLGNYASIYNVQITGNLIAIVCNDSLSLLFWGCATSIQIACIAIQVQNISSSSDSFNIAALFNYIGILSQVTIINTNIIILNAKLNGSFSTIANVIQYGSGLVVYNLTVCDNNSFHGQYSGLLFINTNSSNITLLNVSLIIYILQISTNSSYFCVIDQHSCITLTNVIIISNGTYQSNITQSMVSFGGFYNGTNFTIIDSQIFVNMQCQNRLFYSGTLFGQMSSSSLYLIQTFIGGTIILYSNNQNYAVGVIGNISNTLTILNSSINETILSTYYYDNRVGFVGQCMNLSLANLSVNITVSTQTSNNTYYFGFAGYLSSQVQLLYCNFAINASGNWDVGVLAGVMAPLNVTSCVVTGYANGSYQVGLFVGSISGALSQMEILNNLNVSGAIRIFNSSYVSLFIGRTDVGANFTNVNVISSTVSSSTGVTDGGALVGFVWGGTVTLSNCTVSGVSVAANVLFGMVAGGLNYQQYAQLVAVNVSVSGCTECACFGNSSYLGASKLSGRVVGCT